jgi:NADP-dependent 3-hydroxy acid dehydrogenase YdfG
MIDTSLTGRTALVTGASSGIGAATAELLAAQGASVALLARRQDRLDELAGKIAAAGGRALAVPVDVTDPDALDEAARRVTRELGDVDLVVANAGVMLPRPAEDGRIDEWQRMIGINVTGLLATVRAFVPQLLAAAADENRKADLVTISSIAAHSNFPTYAVYTATKAAVTAFAASLRTELGPRGVRITNIEPGAVVSELVDHVTRDHGVRDHLDEWIGSLDPLAAEDIAGLVAYATSRPGNVNLRQVVALPTGQV